MTNNKLTFGIIGDGVSAFRHAHEICVNPAFKLLSLAYKDREKGLETARRHFIEDIENDGDYLLRRDDIDVVVLSLPTDDHSFWVKNALEYSKIVVVESPLTHSIEEALTFLSLLDEGYFIFNANPYLYLPGIPRDGIRHSYTLTFSSSTFDEGDMVLIALETALYYFGNQGGVSLSGNTIVMEQEYGEGRVEILKTGGELKMSLVLDGVKRIDNLGFYDALPYFYSFLLSRLENGGSMDDEFKAAVQALEIQRKLFPEDE